MNNVSTAWLYGSTPEWACGSICGTEEAVAVGSGLVSGWKNGQNGLILRYEVVQSGGLGNSNPSVDTST